MYGKPVIFRVIEFLTLNLIIKLRNWISTFSEIHLLRTINKEYKFDERPASWISYTGKEGTVIFKVGVVIFLFDSIKLRNFISPFLKIYLLRRFGKDVEVCIESLTFLKLEPKNFVYWSFVWNQEALFHNSWKFISYGD